MCKLIANCKEFHFVVPEKKLKYASPSERSELEIESEQKKQEKANEDAVDIQAKKEWETLWNSRNTIFEGCTIFLESLRKE